MGDCVNYTIKFIEFKAAKIDLEVAGDDLVKFFREKYDVDIYDNELEP